MKKTSIYLEPELDRALARVAERDGVTKAEAVRRAIRTAVADEVRPRLSAIGIGEGPGDVSADIDRHLRDTGFGTT